VSAYASSHADVMMIGDDKSIRTVFSETPFVSNKKMLLQCIAGSSKRKNRM